MSKPTYIEMRKLSKKELIERCDRAIMGSMPSADQYIQEIWRRDQAEQMEIVVRLAQVQTEHAAALGSLTRWIFWLTLVVAVATLLQLAIALKLFGK